jgi:hypothetical protein
MSKIDLIIDSLNGCKGLTELDNVCIAEALAAARKVRKMKPEGIRVTDGADLYALDEVNK